MTVLDTCPACLVREKEVVLCAPHAAEDREVVTRELKRVRSKNEEEQIAALEAIAALTRAHQNAPSPRVVKALAVGLDQDSLVVQATAGSLLGPPQHALDALDLLLDRLDRADRELAKILAEQRRLREKVPQPEPIRAPYGSKQYWDELGEQLQRGTKESLKLSAVLSRAHAAVGLKSILVLALAEFPDDRAVAAVLRSEELLATDAGTVSLFALGSRPAVATALAAAARWHAEPVPEDEKAREHRATRARFFQQALEELAQERGLLPCPVASELPLTEWQAWLERHRAALPESLPGLRSPVW